MPPEFFALQLQYDVLMTAWLLIQVHVTAGPEGGSYGGHVFLIIIVSASIGTNKLKCTGDIHSNNTTIDIHVCPTRLYITYFISSERLHPKCVCGVYEISSVRHIENSLQQTNELNDDIIACDEEFAIQ